MAELLVNRVAQSGITTINLEEYFPTDPIVTFDLKNFLFMEAILKEKDFRTDLKNLDWSQYRGKIVLVTCSADAIIPMWAYMLVGAYLNDVATTTYCGTEVEYLSHYYDEVLSKLNLSSYEGKMVVIKGCGEKSVPPLAYMKLTTLLKPVAKSIMYGEPCSTVPIYKQPRKNP